AVAPAAVLELERHRRGGVRGQRRDDVLAPTLVAGRLAVEREAQRVQYGALARPGRAVDQEQAVGAQALEVDLVRPHEGAEVLEPPARGPHAGTPAAAASSPITPSR